MAIEGASLRSRRNVLAAFAGAVAGVIASSATGAQRAFAADSGPITIGNYYSDIEVTTALINPTNSAAILDLNNQQGGSGISAASNSGDAIFSQSQSGNGLRAVSSSGAGLYTQSSTGSAVRAFGGTVPCVDAQGEQSWAVYAHSTHSAGVVGSSGTTKPVVSHPRVGVYGVADQSTGTGVQGASKAGRGAQFSGGVAQLRLVPSARLSHPANGQAGDLFLDAHYRLWLCQGGANWKQVSLG